MKLILASKSPYRRALMDAAGLNFQTESSPFDEEDFKNQNRRLNSKELCLKLAEGKALALAEQYKSDLILGSDQLIELEQQALDKPGSLERAVAQLKSLSGKVHHVHTSLVLIGPGKKMFSTIRTIHVRMRNLSEDEILHYVELDQPLDCAGSYKMERGGLLLAESVESSDPSAIQGLSMIDLTIGLKHFGKSPLDFWKGST